MPLFCPKDLPDFVAPEILEGRYLPSVFYSPHDERAWAIALGGRNQISPVAQRLVSAHTGIKLREKQVKDVPLASVLSGIYGSLSYIVCDPENQNGWPRSVTLHRYLPQLLQQLLPKETCDAHAETYSISQIIPRLRERFPEALELVSLGLDTSHYPNLLILPMLVERFFQIEVDRLECSQAVAGQFPGKVYTQAVMALHIVLCENATPGLAHLALKRWPELRKEFDYAENAEVLRSAGQDSLHPDLVPSVRTLATNLSGMAAHIVNYDRRQISFSVFPRLQELGRHASANLRQAVCETLQASVLPLISEANPQAPCPTIDLLTPVEIGDAVMQLCDEACRLIPESVSKQIRESTRAIAKEQPKTETLRKKINELSADSAKMDVTVLTETANQLARITETVSTHKQALEAALIELRERLNSFEQRWNALCRDPLAPPSCKSEPESDALQRIQTLQHELAETSQENHRLRIKLSALERPGQTAHTLPADLLRKVALERDSCTPCEVLEYLQLIAGDRLVVLPSAWKSAEDSERFEYSARMLELLDTVVFAYAPALASGTADAEARKLLGAAYSSRESETTSKRDILRRVRTFSFEGSPRYFGRHLRVGNCPGKTRGMRIFFDIIQGVVVIAYCGQHLSVNGSN